MKTNYDSPEIEVIEIELEGMLCDSIKTLSAPGVEDDGLGW